jgi:hypothetical protein
MGMLEAAGEWERQLLCSDVLSILKRLFASSWGDRLEHILRHVLLTLLCEPGHTLRDIRPLLSSHSYRRQVLAWVNDFDLQAFWHSEFPGYPASTFAPIYNKLGLLLSSPLVRNIVVQKKSRLNIARCIAERKVMIVSLRQSLIGDDNAHLLGALVISRIQIAAMQSLRQGREVRVPFTLYTDEFQHFIVSSFERILSEAGKAGLSLVMANQFLDQLGAPLQAAVLGNVGALICFQVGPDDARALEKQFGGVFGQEELLSLHRGQAIARIGAAKDSFTIATLPPPKPSRVDGETLADDAMVTVIIERTRQECCRPRTEVEAELAQEREVQTTAEQNVRQVETANSVLVDDLDDPTDIPHSIDTTKGSASNRRSGTVRKTGNSRDKQTAGNLPGPSPEPLLEPEGFGLEADEEA